MVTHYVLFLFYSGAARKIVIELLTAFYISLSPSLLPPPHFFCSFFFFFVVTVIAV